MLHEQLNTKREGLSYLDLRSFAPRYYIRPNQIFVTKEYPYFNLGELLTVASVSTSFYDDFLKNKFIVIGNFETDTHYTPIGKMYGPLILIDAYISLKNGRARLSWGWILFMVASLSVTSYILFFVKIKPPEVKVSPWIDFILHNFLNKIFCFLTICSVIVFLSELLFSIQITISLLFLYLTYVSWIISYYNKHFKKQQP